MMAYNLNESAGKMPFMLNPYITDELKVLFIYGPNFKRETDIFSVPKSVVVVASMVLSFIFGAALLLYVMRRKLRLFRYDFLSATLDCWIPFIGGGILRPEHRLERWFFTILSLGAFFIMAVFSGDLLDCVVCVLIAKVNTFAKLAAINPPIYSPYELTTQQELVSGKLM